ncbi:MAG: hypothetical protein LLG24_05450 [Actinomycetia bacterium]|nr:hypothetical protein [Actinomycetes bacterium]
MKVKVCCAQIALLTLIAMGCSVMSAVAFPETSYPGRDEYGDTCWYTNCHAVSNNDGTGPHGNYSATSNVCSLCHTVHDAPTGGVALLPEPTVTGMCLMCHDGTGSPGSGVYGAIIGRGLTVSSEHSVNATNVIPGGDIGGGDTTRDFSEGGVLGCGDCHTPHGSRTVARFAGERSRNSTKDTFRNAELRSTRLLKQLPTGATTPVVEYGSDWCMACHAGRGSWIGGPMNHPVDSKLTTSAPYVYDRVPRMSSDTATVDQVVGSMGRIADGTEWRVRHNRAFVMPWPRTVLQAGHAPICMQCHEDARSVGAVGAVASATVSTPNGTTATDNPRFQNFPHESTNPKFLVEVGDDLCTNCHPTEQLP